MARRTKTKDTEPPADSATVEADVNPEVDSEPAELAARDSYSPPDYPNDAASDDEPKEPTRPQTKQERRDERYGDERSFDGDRQAELDAQASQE